MKQEIVVKVAAHLPNTEEEISCSHRRPKQNDIYNIPEALFPSQGTIPMSSVYYGMGFRLLKVTYQ